MFAKGRAKLTITTIEELAMKTATDFAPEFIRKVIEVAVLAYVMGILSTLLLLWIFFSLTGFVSSI